MKAIVEVFEGFRIVVTPAKFNLCTPRFAVELNKTEDQ